MNICETTADFDFEKLSLAQPNGLQGGSYFTRLSFNGNPLYIQAPVCKTKQGLVSSGKKTYCDLMFTNNNEEILDWFENLEKNLIDKIYEKRNIWFHNDLEKEDIENAFTSILRIYKGGKYYLVRTNLGNNKSLTEKPFSCFDDQENPVDPEIIKNDNVKVIPLLEFLGVKFSSKSFQIEICLRQLMVLNEQHIFNTCLIKTKSIPELPTDTDNTESLETLEKVENFEETTNLNEPFSETLTANNSFELENEPNNNKENETKLSSENKVDDSSESKKENFEESSILNQKLESTEVNLETPKVNLEHPEVNLEEVNLTFDSLEEDSISLKKPNEVYLELWREARLAAKEARKNAIKAYLNAKNIKATYMLNEIDDDNYDEFDNYLESIDENNLDYTSQ